MVILPLSSDAAIFHWGSARTKNNTVTVATDLSIQEVIDSITDASADKPYIVIVPPGVYTEQITMQQYVSLKGETTSGSIITNSTGPVVTLASNIDLTDITITCTDANSYCIDSGTDTAFWNIDNCYLESLTGSGILFRSTGTNVKSWKQRISDSKIKTNKIGIYASTGYGYLIINNTQIQLVGQNSGNDHVGIQVDTAQRIIMTGGNIFSSWDASERIEEAANNVYGIYIPSSNTVGYRIHLNSVEIMVRNETATDVNAIRADGTSASGFVRIRAGMLQAEDGESNNRTPISCTGSNKIQILGTQLSGLWSALVEGEVVGEYYGRSLDTAYLTQSNFILSDPNAEPYIRIENNNTDYAPQLKFKKSSFYFSMGIDTGDSDKFKIFSGNGIMDTNEFVMTQAGNIGIGTGYPKANLEIAGTLLHNDYCTDPNGSGDITLTLSQCRHGIITDKDLTGDANFILDDEDASLTLQILIVDGTHTISLVPPTGERLWMDGNSFDVDASVNLSSTEGDKFNLKRRYTAVDADYIWNIDKVLSGVITVSEYLQESLVVDPDPNVIFAAESAADTQKTLTIAQPSNSYGEYELAIYNPSTVTDLTLKIMAIETSLGGDTRYGYITSMAIPKSQEISGTTINTKSVFINGIFNGTDCQLIFSNDTVLGVGEGFTCTARIREVK